MRPHVSVELRTEVGGIVRHPAGPFQLNQIVGRTYEQLLVGILPDVTLSGTRYNSHADRFSNMRPSSKMTALVQTRCRSLFRSPTFLM